MKKLNERGDMGLGIILLMAAMMLGMMWGGHKLHERHKKHDSPQVEQRSDEVHGSTAPVKGAQPEMQEDQSPER